ncbi:MAG: glycosyltransferase [Anaerolineales bacterium]
MRILTVIYEFPPVGGGGGKVAEDICRKLAARGHEVGVLTAHWGDLPRDETRDGVRIWRIPSLRRLPYKGDMRAMLGYVLAAIPAGLHIIHRWQPDVLHTHFAVPSGAAAYALSRLSGLPYLLTAHLGDVPGGVPEKTDRWFRWIFPFTILIWRRAARIAAVSDFTRDLAQRHYGVEVQVIPNGVDMSELNPGKIRVGRPPHILFAGRLSPQKNVPGLVRILGRVRDLPWTATVVGDGPQRAEVVAEIARLGLEERVAMPGWVSPGEVVEYMRRADILLMPSLSEGMPVVGVQALAMGLALVVSDIGGFAGLVAQGVNGHLCPVGEDGAFVKALSRLLTDPQYLLACRRNSQQKAAAFDWDDIVTAYEEILQAVCMGASGADVSSSFPALPLK